MKKEFIKKLEEKMKKESRKIIMPVFENGVASIKLAKIINEYLESILLNVEKIKEELELLISNLKETNNSIVKELDSVEMKKIDISKINQEAKRTEIICPNCDRIIKLPANFCTKCGYKLEN